MNPRCDGVALIGEVLVEHALASEPSYVGVGIFERSAQRSDELELPRLQPQNPEPLLQSLFHRLRESKLRNEYLRR